MIGGDDFKSDQTKMKSVMVDFLVSAGIKPTSIVSYNHLGNNDGKNLSAPQTFRSKEISKSNVVDDAVGSNRILYEADEHPDHVVVIKYVPYVADSKRAMDEYTSKIFMGGHNTIVMHNTCEDCSLPHPHPRPRHPRRGRDTHRVQDERDVHLLPLPSGHVDPLLPDQGAARAARRANVAPLQAARLHREPLPRLRRPPAGQPHAARAQEGHARGQRGLWWGQRIRRGEAEAPEEACAPRRREAERGEARFRSRLAAILPPTCPSTARAAGGVLRPLVSALTSTVGQRFETTCVLHVSARRRALCSPRPRPPAAVRAEIRCQGLAFLPSTPRISCDSFLRILGLVSRRLSPGL